MRDIISYVDALRPTVFFQTHTDNFNIGASMYHLMAIQRQFDIIGLPQNERPESRVLHDPYDYVQLQLMTFDLRDRASRDVARGRRSLTCR